MTATLTLDAATPSELRAYCDEHGIEYRPKDSSAQLRRKIERARTSTTDEPSDEIIVETDGDVVGTVEHDEPADPYAGIDDAAQLVAAAIRATSELADNPKRRAIAAYRSLVHRWSVFAALDDVPVPSSKNVKPLTNYAAKPGRAKRAPDDAVLAAAALVLAEAKSQGLVRKTRTRSESKRKQLAPGLVLHKNGKRVARPTSLSFLAWYATPGCDDQPRVGVERFVELLAAAGVSDPYSGPWTATLPTGVVVSAVRES